VSPTPTRNPRLAVAYLRHAGTERSASWPEQRTTIERWAALNGIDVAAWHRDAVEGHGLAGVRPGFAAAIQDVERRGAGLLVVARRDRVAIDVVAEAISERLVERCGAHLVAADGDSESSAREMRLRFAILHALARHESSRDAEDPALARVLDLLQAGASLSAVSEALAAEGLRPPGGAGWTPEAVEALLAEASAPAR
jgi:hypothetical protein